MEGMTTLVHVILREYGSYFFLFQDKKSTSTTDADDNKPTHLVDTEEHCSHQVNSLWFEVNIIRNFCFHRTKHFRSSQSLA